jgi:mRNA-degrading endonuclease RelE of RelBE toxin-antitoxin system
VYRVLIADRAEKEIKRFPQNVIAKIDEKIVALADDPWPMAVRLSAQKMGGV